jgi:anti-sigma B factor antagonist
MDVPFDAVPGRSSRPGSSVFLTTSAWNQIPMAFQVQQEGDVLVIDVDGQLIVGNRQELKTRVLQELEAGARKFLVDFSSTAYIDSSGLGVLVSLSKKIREHGGEFRLSSLNPDLRTLFELTKLDSLFRIHDSRQEGLQSF